MEKQITQSVLGGGRILEITNEKFRAAKSERILFYLRAVRRSDPREVISAQAARAAGRFFGADDLAAATGLERYLGLAVREALGCGDIVKNLLAFARQKNVEARAFDVHEAIQTILLLTSHQLELAGIQTES